MDTYFYEIWSYFGPLVKVGQTKVERMHFCWLSNNWVLKVDLGMHLRHKHGNLFLWDLELFWASIMVCQTNDENMHFCRLSRNWKFKVDLDTHLSDKHGQLFLWYLDLFCPSFKVGQTKVEKMQFFNFLGIVFWKWI